MFFFLKSLILVSIVKVNSKFNLTYVSQGECIEKKFKKRNGLDKI